VNAIIWTLAYTNESQTALVGYIKSSDFYFSSQEKADAKKSEAFAYLSKQNLVKSEEQIRAVPMSELDVAS
jgi:hypothetical protein